VTTKRDVAALVEARRSAGRAVLAAAALRAVREVFADDLPWLAINGPVLDAVLYPLPRLRSYRDLDVLVAPPHVADAVDRLEAPAGPRRARAARRRRPTGTHTVARRGRCVRSLLFRAGDRADRDAYFARLSTM
jgi:hypothetical protein